MGERKRERERGKRARERESYIWTGYQFAHGQLGMAHVVRKQSCAAVITEGNYRHPDRRTTHLSSVSLDYQ